MILADARGRATATRIVGRITLDELLRRAALRRPDASAASREHLNEELWLLLF